MIPLLREWGKLAPHECTFYEDTRPSNPIPMCSIRWRTSSLHKDLDVNFVRELQIELQKLIETRGWLWSLPNCIGRDQNEQWSRESYIDKYRAVIVRTYGPFKYDAVHESSSSESPTEALLQCYVDALRSSKESE